MTLSTGGLRAIGGRPPSPHQALTPGAVRPGLARRLARWPVIEDAVPKTAIMVGAKLLPGEGRQGRHILRQELRYPHCGSRISKTCTCRCRAARLVDKSWPGRVRPARVRIAGRRKVGPGGDELVREDFLLCRQRRRLARSRNAQNSAVPEREQELDIEGVGCQGGEARHVGEVIGRILVVEFMFVDRIVRPVRPQGTDDVIAADAGCVPSRSQIGCALVYCSGDGYWASTAASMPAG
jgi:hypothetical protein